MVMLKKITESEVKEVSPRVLELVGSTEVQDRANDTIRQDGWDLKNYKKNPVFLWAHDYSQPPIGKANRVWVDKDEKKLKFHIEFAPPETYPFADTVYRLYKGGFLRATSVGFMPKNWEGKANENDAPKYNGNVFTEQELWELSACPVPANPEALSMAVKNGIITAKDVLSLGVELKDGDSLPISVTVPFTDGMTYSAVPVTKPEETEEYVRIPVDTGDHSDHKIRTIDVSAKEGIKGLYCVDDKKIITYLFSKEKGWTMDKAKQWVEDHKKEGHLPTQAEIRDEMDYLLTMIEMSGIAEENEVLATDLFLTLKEMLDKREPESDISVKIEDPYINLSGEDLKRISDMVRANITERIYKLKGKIY